MPTHPPIVAAFYASHYSHLVRYVAHAYPGLCSSRVEDAVSDAFLICCGNPDLLANAHAQGGERQVFALMKVIAWRCARASTCRGSHRHELPVEEYDPQCGQAAGQEIVADLRLHLLGAAMDASRRVLPSAPDRLAAAIIDRLTSGETDGAVAARHDLRREYVNNARRLLQQRVGFAAA